MNHRHHGFISCRVEKIFVLNVECGQKWVRNYIAFNVVIFAIEKLQPCSFGYLISTAGNSGGKTITRRLCLLSARRQMLKSLAQVFANFILSLSFLKMVIKILRRPRRVVERQETKGG